MTPGILNSPGPMGYADPRYQNASTKFEEEFLTSILEFIGQIRESRKRLSPAHQEAVNDTFVVCTGEVYQG